MLFGRASDFGRYDLGRSLDVVRNENLLAGED